MRAASEAEENERQTRQRGEKGTTMKSIEGNEM